jgi:hypothetical protein
MKIWQAVVLGLWGLALAGCRSDPSRELLELDNFKKGQEIYRLRCRLEDLEEQLNSSAPAQPASRAITRPAAPGEASPAPSWPGNTAPRPGPALLSAPRTSLGPAEPSIGPLQISPGIEAPTGEVPNTLRGPGGAEPKRMPAPGGSSQWKPADVRLASGAAPIDNQSVAQITLHPSLTGGIGGGNAGDEGLLVVVEPRDFAGNIVPVAGETSVALIDPSLTGEEARLARWDFSAAQAERAIHAGSEPGIHLRLPWRSAPPHDRLKVFVRYTTRDGRKLQAERIIAVALHDDGPRSADAADPLRESRTEPPRRTNNPDRSSGRRPQWSPDRD